MFSLAELKRLVDFWSAEYPPDTWVQFLYPKSFRGKTIAHVGSMTGHSAVGSERYTLRFLIDYARVPSPLPVPDSE